MIADSTAGLRRLRDRHEIGDVIRRCGRASDRADLEMMRSCYHPDAFENHGYFRGNAWQFVEQAMRLAAVRHPDGGSHFLGMPSIELDGDFATSETYVRAIMRTRDEAGHHSLLFARRYLDTVTRRHDGWRIQARVGVYDYGGKDANADPAW